MHEYLTLVIFTTFDKFNKYYLQGKECTEALSCIIHSYLEYYTLEDESKLIKY